MNGSLRRGKMSKSYLGSLRKSINSRVGKKSKKKKTKKNIKSNKLVGSGLDFSDNDDDSEEMVGSVPLQAHMMELNRRVELLEKKINEGLPLLNEKVDKLASLNEKVDKLASLNNRCTAFNGSVLKWDDIMKIQPVL